MLTTKNVELATENDKLTKESAELRAQLAEQVELAVPQRQAAGSHPINAPVHSAVPPNAAQKGQHNPLKLLRPNTPHSSSCTRSICDDCAGDGDV